MDSIESHLRNPLFIGVAGKVLLHCSACRIRTCMCAARALTWRAMHASTTYQEPMPWSPTHPRPRLSVGLSMI